MSTSHSRAHAHTHPNPRIGRRGLLLLGVLAGCGGGGGTPAEAPQVMAFSADKTAYTVGERARLLAVFKGGEGRVEPGIGPVRSGVAVDTPLLDAGKTYELTVTAADGRQVRQLLLIAAGPREEFQALPTPLAAAGHQAVRAADGAVLLIGGSRGGNAPSAQISRFVPGADRFEDFGQLQIARRDHSATRLANGQILVIGGNTLQSQSDTAELVDEASGLSILLAPLQAGRVEHRATMLADGQVLVTGGVARLRSDQGRLAELWNPADRQFRAAAQPMQRRRAAHSATLLADGRVLVFGGYQAESASYLGAEIYDPRSGGFTPLELPAGLGSAGAPRANHAAVRLSDGSVLIAGGEDAGSSLPLASVLRFDPASDSFTRLPNLPEARTAAVAVVDAADEVLLLGGYAETAPAAFSTTALAYHPTRGGRRLAAPMSRRQAHSATRLLDGRVLIVGGELGGGPGLQTQALLFR